MAVDAGHLTMKLIALTAIIAAAATMGASPAPPLAAAVVPSKDAAAQPGMSPIGKGQCFFTRDMRNHTVGSDRELYLDVGGRGTYKVTMSNACLAGASSSDPLVVRNFTGSDQVCRPLDFDVSIAHSGIGVAIPCIVSSIALLAPAEVEALPKKLRP